MRVHCGGVGNLNECARECTKVAALRDSRLCTSHNANPEENGSLPTTNQPTTEKQALLRMQINSLPRQPSLAWWL